MTTPQQPTAMDSGLIKPSPLLYLLLAVLGFGSGTGTYFGLAGDAGLPIQDRERLIRIDEGITHIESRLSEIELQQKEMLTTITDNTRRIDSIQIGLVNQANWNNNTQMAIENLVKITQETQVQLVRLSNRPTTD